MDWTRKLDQSCVLFLTFEKNQEKRIAPTEGSPPGQATMIATEFNQQV